MSARAVGESAAIVLRAKMPVAVDAVPVAARSGQVLAHPVVHGAAGPFARVGIVLDRKPAPPQGNFSGRLLVEGSRAKVFAVPGPGEPDDFFLLDVQAVMFARVDADPGNAVFVMYDSSRIGPRNGTDHTARVFRVTADCASRQPGAIARAVPRS